MSTVHPGDVVVVAVNGLFGQRMCDVAARCGAYVVPVEHEWGTAVDVQRVLDAHPSPAIIAAVHAETSTGVRSDVAELGAAKGDALLIVDAVTSIAGASTSATPAPRSAWAWHRVWRRSRSTTAPSRAARSRSRGTWTWTWACSAGTSARRPGRAGPTLFAQKGHRRPELTTVNVPEGVDSAAVRKHLLDRYEIEIGAGPGSTPRRSGE
ncbi:MAG: aminotransferase class V-fold PLP-dependent enzyme [Marmoricola sp.]